MGWEGFMRTEREQIRQRREGKLRRTLGRPLPGESFELLDGVGKRDRVRAAQGLVSIKGGGSRISYKHLDDLSSLDMRFRIAAEWVMVGWLKERVARRKQGASAPPVPKHLLG
jgi:hypothetical protein